MKYVVFVSFLVLTISIGHFGVSCQYIQYRANAVSSLKSRLASAVNDKKFDTVTEYEYYDDDFGTTESFAPTTASTTTTSTTTSKPITSYRLLTTHRNGFRPLVNGNTKINSDTRQYQQQQRYQPDSNTEASNESAFVQKNNNNNQQSASSPHFRNAIADVNRRTVGKDHIQEKSASNDIDSSNGNGGGFSRRYARFLFKQRTG